MSPKESNPGIPPAKRLTTCLVPDPLNSWILLLGTPILVFSGVLAIIISFFAFMSYQTKEVFYNLVEPVSLELKGGEIMKNLSIEYDRGLFGSTAKTVWSSSFGPNIELTHKIRHGIINTTIETTLTARSDFKNMLSHSQKNVIEEPLFAYAEISPFSGAKRISFKVSDMKDEKAIVTGLKGFFKFREDGEIVGNLELKELGYSPYAQEIKDGRMEVGSTGFYIKDIIGFVRVNQVGDTIDSAILNLTINSFSASTIGQSIGFNTLGLTFNLKEGGKEFEMEGAISNASVKEESLDVLIETSWVTIKTAIDIEMAKSMASHGLSLNSIIGDSVQTLTVDKMYYHGVINGSEVSITPKEKVSISIGSLEDMAEEIMELAGVGNLASETSMFSEKTSR